MISLNTVHAIASTSDPSKNIPGKTDPDTGKKYDKYDLLNSKKKYTGKRNEDRIKITELYNSLQLHIFISNQDYPIVIESLEFLKDKIIEHL